MQDKNVISDIVNEYCKEIYKESGYRLSKLVSIVILIVSGIALVYPPYTGSMTSIIFKSVAGFVFIIDASP